MKEDRVLAYVRMVNGADRHAAATVRKLWPVFWLVVAAVLVICH